MPAAQLHSAEATGRRLAFQLWVCSILCWWGLGIPFSRLWWLVNEKQLNWIFICYAWEVPVLGWTGAVLVPWLLWQQLTDNLAYARAPSGPARPPVRRRRPGSDRAPSC